MEISEFLQGIQSSPKKFTVKELRAREELWRVLWSWLDDNIKDFLIRAGSVVRVVRRDYRSSIGELGVVHFEIKEIELHVYEKSYDYGAGKYFWEDKVVKIPGSVLAWYEFVATQEEVEEEPLPSLENLIPMNEPE